MANPTVCFRVFSSLMFAAGTLSLAQCSSTPPAGGDGGEDGASSSSSGGTSSGGSSSGSSSGTGSSSGASSSGSGGGALSWYYTCGYPSCPVSTGDAAAAGLTDDAGTPCPATGSACTVSGELCGTASNFHCGSVEQCAASDPTMTKYGCPISSRVHKDGIEYVSDEELQALHDETLRFQLATYNYKPDVADPGPRHLGFLIEDTPPATPAVGWSRERVDLYGYLSMVVATMQVQEKEIAELRRELAEASRKTPARR